MHRKHLLAEHELTLSKALTVAKSWELAEQNAYAKALTGSYTYTRSFTVEPSAGGRARVRVRVRAGVTLDPEMHNYSQQTLPCAHAPLSEWR